jgi:hypothetical protein
MARREMTRFAESLREEGRQPAGPPDDPFTDPPRKVQTDPDRRIIWSVGLDMFDDGGRLLYDPTNGVESRGDIVVEFPDTGIPTGPGKD